MSIRKTLYGGGLGLLILLTGISALVWTGLSEAQTSQEVAISAMVSEVNGDTLYQFLEQLTGEAPVYLDDGERWIQNRNSGSWGMEWAAEYMTDLFEEYGYTVEYQYFRFDYDLRTILVEAGGVGLAAGAEGMIIRSVGGSPWTRVKAGIDTIDAVYLSLDRAANDDYVLVGRDGVIVTSDDGGMSWIPRNSGTGERLSGVDVLSGGVGWAVGANGVILTTADGGASWTPQASGVSSALRDVQGFDASTAVVVGDGGVILRTTDGGLTWVPVESGVSADLNSACFVGSTGWAVGDGGTVLSTFDAGLTWNAQTSGTTGNLFDVSFADLSVGWAVGISGTILHTDDGGGTWILQTSPNPTVNFWGVAAVSAEEAWSVGLGGYVIGTADGGDTWEDRGDAVLAGWLNVEATKLGTLIPDEDVLLVGHYDSIALDGGQYSEIAPGADDNGSGTAVVVEAARVMSGYSFERTIKFICFSGEEQDLLGSTAYVQRAVELGSQIAAVFNLDGVGWNDDHLRMISNEDSRWLGDLALNTGTEYAPDLTQFHIEGPPSPRSDHLAFWLRGFPAILGTQPEDPYPEHYHSPGDTLGLLDLTFISNVAKVGVATIAMLAAVDTTLTAVADGRDWERETSVCRLGPLWPNPFNPVTTIGFSVPDRRRVKIQIFASTGRLVRALLDEPVIAGTHSVTWDGRDHGGHESVSGVYFCRMEAGEFRRTEKLVLLK